MSKELLFILAGLLLGTWFLVDEKRSVMEKIGMIIGLVALYFVYQYFFHGPTFMEVISPLIKQPESL